MKSIGVLVTFIVLGCALAYPQQTEVRVEVSDPAGQPVSGAAVVLESSEGSMEMSDMTDSAGIARFEAGEGSYRFTVSADGFQVFKGQTILAGGTPVLLKAVLELLTVETTVQVVESLPAPIAAERRRTADLETSPTGDLAEQLKAIPGVLDVRRGATNMDRVVQGLRESQLAVVVDGTRTFAAG
ncbi:MAG: hypothetical protein GY953_55105, partial [bacterium]|nr:hypothetical protein [bacterium]